MESIWKPKTNYFIQLSVVKLQEVLDDVLIDIIGYNPEKEWGLGSVCRGLKYVSEDEVVINIQIGHLQFTEVKLKDGSVINALGVLDYIDSQDFDLAKYYFQVDEFLSQEEYDGKDQYDING